MIEILFALAPFGVAIGILIGNVRKLNARVSELEERLDEKLEKEI